LIVAVTALVLPSITDTVSDPSLATYTVSLVGSTPTPTGVAPTGMVAVTAPDAASITETVFERPFET
jgi:hypothetical protein